jgi:hypothetical protein
MQALIMLTLAMALQSEPAVQMDPDLVYCDVRFDMLYGHPLQIRSDCPDVENIEAMTEQSYAQLRDAQPSLMDIDRATNEGRIYYRFEDHGDFVWWRLQPGVITQIEPEYPSYARRVGISGACSASYDIIEGRPENICIRCRADDLRTHFIREMRRSIRRSYYVNHDEPLAMTYQYEFPHPDNPSPGFPDVPDCSD